MKTPSDSPVKGVPFRAATARERSPAPLRRLPHTAKNAPCWFTSCMIIHSAVFFFESLLSAVSSCFAPAAFFQRVACDLSV